MLRSSLTPLAFALSATMAANLYGPAFAASGDRIGDAVVITNIVMADFAKEERRLSRGDNVRQDEIIEVNTDAQGEFKLDDDTKLALGPGSRLVLDKFVYDSDKKTGSIVMEMAKGAFRFITGVASKPTYVINTPNASITVRGTIFDTYVLPDKSVWVLLHEGAIEATGKRNVCRVLDRPGQMMHIAADGTVTGPFNWAKLPDNNAVGFDTAFPFVINSPTIDPNPQLTRSQIIEANLADEPAQKCINPHPQIIPGPPVKTRKAQAPQKTPPKKKIATRRPKGDGGYGDDCPGCMTGIGIAIGAGMGGFGGHRGGYGDGGNRGR
ncbi:FecR domain-containing protein [Hyphomicrobium sp.]|uniref:FecR family protein n=1 Tax=Hyphomicrobium sp. TaxID=82 RepID=UPI000F9F8077|nr:FecR domain-containing protein [Hyphomicrobium sp.]RUO97923.1 MAG: iron dicitrate transport regulator FecR [Hyphomicrobium sp.]